MNQWNYFHHTGQYYGSLYHIILRWGQVGHGVDCCPPLVVFLVESREAVGSRDSVHISLGNIGISPDILVLELVSVLGGPDIFLPWLGLV